MPNSTSKFIARMPFRKTTLFCRKPTCDAVQNLTTLPKD